MGYSFNPRSYKRSDKLWSCASDLHYTFNPRSYKRSDIFSCHLQPARQLSIHAPTRGATLQSVHCLKLIGFQSTLLQEERLQCARSVWLYIRFQSTLLQEERRKLVRKHGIVGAFQSTLLQEERRENPHFVEIIETFNPRSYKRSDTMASHRVVHP